MRIGKIQQDVLLYLARCGEKGGYIGQGTKAQEFQGLTLEQVERAIAGLLRRKIIKREGIRYIRL